MTENCWLKTLDGTVVRPSLAVRFDVQPDFYDLGRRGSLIVLRVHVNGPRSRDNAATTEASISWSCPVNSPADRASPNLTRRQTRATLRKSHNSQLSSNL